MTFDKKMFNFALIFQYDQIKTVNKKQPLRGTNNCDI